MPRVHGSRYQSCVNLGRLQLLYIDTGNSLVQLFSASPESECSTSFSYLVFVSIGVGG